MTNDYATFANSSNDKKLFSVYENVLDFMQAKIFSIYKADIERPKHGIMHNMFIMSDEISLERAFYVDPSSIGAFQFDQDKTSNRLITMDEHWLSEYKEYLRLKKLFEGRGEK